MLVTPWLRRTLNKVYPDHWSFLLGEIALYSFLILLLSGTYLTFFFDASMREVVYEGSYAPLRGVEMSAAYDSALALSFDVRGGLFMRQLHHWAALLFVAAIVVHLLRIFFTGAFRKPRETNWLLGVVMMVLALLMGVTGYSLPDDLLSGTGLRIISAILLSIPVIGTWAHFAVFNGDFVGEEIIGRFYILHVLLIPAILLALIGLHLLILVKQKHTQFPGAGRTEHNVVGNRLFPTFAAKATGLIFVVFGVCALLGGLVQINPIWLWGPYNPAQVSAASQPDWYIGFLDGSTRIFPAWDINLPGDYNDPGAVLADGRHRGRDVHGAGALPVHRAEAHRRHRVAPPAPASARRSGADLARGDGPDLLRVADDRRRQRRHRGQVRHQPERDDVGRPHRRRRSCRRSRTCSPTASASACRCTTARSSSTASRPVSSGACPTASSSRCTSRWVRSTSTGTARLAYGGAPVPKRMNHVGGARRAIRGFFSPIEEPAQVELEQQAEGRGLAAGESRELTTSGRPAEGGRPADGGPSVGRRTPAGAARLTGPARAARQQGPGGFHRGPAACPTRCGAPRPSGADGRLGSVAPHRRQGAGDRPVEALDQPLHRAGRGVRRKRVRRHEHPQEQVDDDAGARRRGESDEADPPQQRVDAAVVGQAAADTADHPVGAAAAQLRAHGGPGRRGCCSPARRVRRTAVRGEAVRMSCQKPAERSRVCPSGKTRIRPWFRDPGDHPDGSPGCHGPRRTLPAGGPDMPRAPPAVAGGALGGAVGQLCWAFCPT